MPAKSDKQRNFFRMVKGVQSGDVPEKDVSDRVKKVAKSMKPSDVDDFVEESSMNEVDRDSQFSDAFKTIRWTRKPSNFDEIPQTTGILGKAKQAIIWIMQNYGVPQIRSVSDYFQSPPPNDAQYFVAQNPKGDLYLIDTQGFDYPRHMAKLPNEFKRYVHDSKYTDLFNEHTLKGMYESLKKQYSNKH